MRITDTSTYTSLAAQISSSSTRVASRTEQLSSGKEVQQFSDSPSDAVAITQIADQQSASAAYGGDSSTAVSQVAGTWTFTGDDGVINRQVGNGVQIQVNTNGRSLFGFGGAPGTDVFSTLDKLAPTGNPFGVSWRTSGQQVQTQHAVEEPAPDRSRAMSATTVFTQKRTPPAPAREHGDAPPPGSCPVCGERMVIDLVREHAARCEACGCTIMLGQWD